MGIRKFLAILTCILIAILITVIWFFPTNDDFSVDNPFWNGTEDIMASGELVSLSSFEQLPPDGRGATLILIPYEELTNVELDRLHRFVLRGGRLIIADDYGYGNAILERMELDARFSGQVLLDPLVYYSNKYLPVIYHIEPNPLTAETDSLVMNHATGLINIGTLNILAMSSSFSFLDGNDNGTCDDDELSGPLPVLSQHELGDGEVILVADPSLFINAMDSIEGNSRFIQNIVGTSNTVYIDQSHLPTSELSHTRNALAQIRDFLSNPAVTAVLVAAVVGASLIPIWYRKKNARKTELK
jgi:hypothetical protein